MGSLRTFWRRWWHKIVSIWTADAVSEAVGGASVAVPKFSSVSKSHDAVPELSSTSPAAVPAGNSKPMTAPEVPLRKVLPVFAESKLTEMLHRGCWSFLSGICNWSGEHRDMCPRQ